MKLTILILIVATIGGAADAITTIVQQRQLQVQGGSPGQMLVVGTDGKSVVTANQAAAQTVVLGSPAALGCVATTTPGRYALPVTPASVAVYRNGLRASMPGEWTVAANLVTITSPIPDEVVLCDYTVGGTQ